MNWLLSAKGNSSEKRASFELNSQHLDQLRGGCSSPLKGNQVSTTGTIIPHSSTYSRQSFLSRNSSSRLLKMLCAVDIYIRVLVLKNILSMKYALRQSKFLYPICATRLSLKYSTLLFGIHVFISIITMQHSIHICFSLSKNKKLCKLRPRAPLTFVGVNARAQMEFYIHLYGINQANKL